MPFPWIGAAIGAAGSVISGLLGKDDGKTETTVNYKQMANAARRAGFNPLTVLRNGGSAGFQTTHAPAMSAFSGIGPAVSILGDALMAYDPQADARAALEDRLKEAQIKALTQSGGGSRMRSFDVPSSQGSTRTTNANGTSPVYPRITQPGTAVLDPPTNPHPTGLGIKIDTRFTDAEYWEQRYGEILSEVAGVMNAVVDGAANVEWPKEDSSTWKAIGGALSGTTPGNAVRHFNLPANRGW